MSYHKHLSLILTLLMCALVVSVHAKADDFPTNYTLVDKIYIPGLTRWDYLTFDPNGHRLFITHGESVDVLDVITKKIIGTIPDTKGVHGVALASELNRGFTSNGAANTVTIFDLATLHPITTVPTGTKPDAIAYDAFSKRVFTANGKSNDMTVINAEDGRVLDTIKLNSKPEFTVVDGRGRLYVNIEDTSQLTVIDTKALKIINTYALSPQCDSPTGLAIDTVQERLFSVCGNKTMVVLEAESGKILTALAIGAHSDAALFDPETKIAFSANGEGTLTLVGNSSPTSYKVLATVPTLPTARTMAFDPATHALYLAAAETDGLDPADSQHKEARPHFKPGTFMILVVGPKATDSRLFP